MNDQYTLQEFGQMIKQKYPTYQDIDDVELANKILEKYPTYQDLIKKKEDGELEMPSQEEFVPASTEDFLAFTPTSGQADTDLGLSSKKTNGPLSFTQVKNDFFIPEVKEKDYFQKLKDYADSSLDPEAKTFYDLEMYTNSNEYEVGPETKAAVPDMFSMSYMAEVEAEEAAKERLMLAEEVVRQSVRNLVLTPAVNTLANAIGGTVNNVKNSVASKVATRESLLGNDFKADQISNLLDADREEQERKKAAQQIALGVSEENARRGIFDTFFDGDVSDGFTKLFVEGTYAAIDAPRTAAPFMAGMGAGAAVTGINVASDEYARRISDLTLSKSEKMAYAMSHAAIESVLAYGFGEAGLGLQNVASKLGKQAFEKGLTRTNNIIRSKGAEFFREVGGEGIEEGLVSAFTQITDQYLDSEFGKDPEKFSYNSVLDAAVLGIIGAGGPSSLTLASMPSSKQIPHSAVAEEKRQIVKELKDLKRDYDNETNPDLKEIKRQKIEDKFRAFDALNGMEAEAYLTLSDDDAAKIASINRRMADLKMQLQSKKDLAGIEYNEDQLKQKQEEFDSLNEIKKEIEGQAFSKAYAEENKGQLPLFVEDSEGRQVETVSKATPKDVTEQHSKMEREEAVEDEQQVASFEAETETPVEEKPSGFVEFSIEDITFEKLSESNIPTEAYEEILASKAASENSLKASGTRVVFHEPDSYAKNIHGVESAQQMVDEIDPENPSFSFGYYDSVNNVIHLYDHSKLDYTNSDIKPENLRDTIRHEFIHAGFSSIIGQDAESRSRLYAELESLAKKDARFKSIIDRVESIYKGRPDSDKQEEAIREFLQDYTVNSAKYKGFVQRIIDAINLTFRKNKINLQITSEVELMNLAKKFDSALKTKRSIDVKNEKETQLEKEGRFSKPEFTYLKDAEVHYTFAPQLGANELAFMKKYIYTYQDRPESIKVKDYNHFKNWYNKMTGNGRAPVIKNMYYVVDGKKRTIKPPKPKLNKDGTVAWVDRPLSFSQRLTKKAIDKEQQRSDFNKSVVAARNEAFKILQDFGVDTSVLYVDNFIPREEGVSDNQFRYTEKTPEMYEAAIRNIQALIESGYDPKESFKRSYSRSENIEMYTMAEGDYMTPQEQMIDELTKPDAEGEPRSIGEGRFSRPDVKARSLSADAEKSISQAVESGRAKRIDRNKMNDKAFKAYAYDKTLNGFFGSVNIGKYFSVNLNSGVNNTGILSSVSAERGKSLQGDIVKAIKEAKNEGLDEFMIIYTAQDEKYITGNPQVFDVSIDFIIDYLSRVASESEQEAVNSLQHTRLRSFLERSGKIKYIRGSEIEPGVVKALRVALPKMMAESNNPEYLELLERYDIGENREHKTLVLPDSGRSDKYNPNDINTLRLAIKELGQSRKIGEYLSDLRSEYKEIREKKGEKGEIPYLENFFGFRIALIDALMSPTDGFYEDGHPSKTYEGLKAVNGRPIGPKDLKDFFVNPMLKDFKTGEIMAVKVIKLAEGQSFNVEDRSVGDDIKAFPFEIVQEGADAESSLVMIPEDRYHYLDFDSKKVISLFEGYYDKKILKISDELGVNIDEIKNSKLYRAERSKIALEAKEKTLGALSRIGQSGFSGITQFGPQFSMLKGMKKREMVSPDRHISTTRQVNMQGMYSQPDFIESTDDSGNVWNLRSRTSIQQWADKWIVRLQDKYRMVFLLQQDVESFKGRTVKEADDFKNAEATMYGKTAEALESLDGRLEQITEAMKTSKITVDELSEYLYALHAEERNRVIEERTNGELKDGSGISTEEANRILSSYVGKKKDSMDDIVSMVRGMQQDTRDTMVKFGLETKKAIDAFEEMFSNYIPLSGLATDEESSVTSAYPTGGAGLSVFGDQTKRAKGRKTRAENVLAQAVAQNASVHIEARKNEAMNALYNLVKNNPNPNVWKIVDSANALDPHTVSVRVNGEQKFIRFKDASYANALKNMNIPQTNQFIRLIRMPSNWLRAAFTTQNPEFLLGNFSRDISQAVFNAAAEAEIEGGFLNGERAMGDLFKKVGPSLKALLKEATGREAKADPVMMRYYQEFKEDGGKTGWAYIKPLEEIAKDLEARANEKTRTQEILGKAKNVLDFVEGINDAFENSIRVASYIAARENGVSRAKAAELAKNITVNFNKHGEWGQTLNAVYLFFNASVQGTARLGRSLVGLKPPVKPDGVQREWYERATTAQKMAAGLTIFNGMLTMIGMAMSDEDEDGELFWTKIPDYVKERNIVIMRPDGKNYFKIPMPYGFNVFANMGTAAVEGAAGTRDFASGSMFVASSFINSFSPISFGQSKDLSTKALKSIIPTPIKPIVDIATNETYFGSPVYSKRWDESQPSSSMSFRSPEAVKSFFSWMNEATGGSQDVPGALDFNPDKLWYGVEYFMGGPGLFVERTAKTVRRLNAKVIEKEDVDIGFNDIPMLRIIYGEPSKYYDLEKYADRKNLLKGLDNEMNRTKDFNNPRYTGVTNLQREIKKTERRLKKLRAERKQARNIKDFAKRTSEIQRIMDLERREIMSFNRYYNELRED